MSSERELLALRRELLVARATLQRLKIGIALQELREDLRWPRAIGAIVASPGVRRLALGVLLLVAGRLAAVLGHLFRRGGPRSS